MRAAGTGSARRRRERRLRSMLRHGRMAVAMAVAEATHHSSPGQKSATVIRVEEVHELYDGPRAQKRSPPGKRPAPDPRPARACWERPSRHRPSLPRRSQQKSVDELVASRSIVGRNDFPDYYVLDAMIASALKRLLDRHIHFHKRESVRRAACSKNTTDSYEGDKIAYMICEHFRASGANEAQGLQICSEKVCRMTSKTSTSEGIKLCLHVNCPQV